MLLYLSNIYTVHINNICFLKLFYLGGPKAFEGGISEKTLIKYHEETAFCMALGRTALFFNKF